MQLTKNTVRPAAMEEVNDNRTRWQREFIYETVIRRYSRSNHVGCIRRRPSPSPHAGLGKPDEDGPSHYSE
jgi:hypothetical protein